jgi:hypothetical protein
MITLQLVSLVLFIFGAFASLRTWHNNRRNSDSRFWPTTRGEIIDSGLAVETVTVPNGRPITLYSAAVRYRFQLGRKFYESTRIKPVADFKSSKSAGHRAVAARYPVGRIVQVRYDPHQIGVAILEPDSRFSLDAKWLLSVGFLMLGTAGVIAATVHP